MLDFVYVLLTLVAFGALAILAGAIDRHLGSGRGSE